jgi:Tol biopolymer transport system component
VKFIELCTIKSIQCKKTKRNIDYHHGINFRKVNKIVLLYCFLTIGIIQGADAKEQILFSKYSDDGYWQIWQMDTSGESQKQITTSPGDKREPFWIGPENKFGYRTSNGELFLCGLTSLDCKELVENLKPISSPHYAPQTHELVFVRFLPQQADVGDIWKIDLKTGETKVLSQSRFLSFQPRISSDGEKIVFIQKDEERLNQIWIMKADGSNQVKITEEYGRLASPELSADKQKILFTSNYRNNDFDLYQIDVDTKAITAVVQNEGMDTSPSYSLDNAHIVFVSNRSGESQIWAVDLPNGSPKQLTLGTASVDPIAVDIEEGTANQ